MPWEYEAVESYWCKPIKIVAPNNYCPEWTVFDGSARKEYLSQASGVLNVRDIKRSGICKSREIGE